MSRAPFHARSTTRRSRRSVLSGLSALGIALVAGRRAEAADRHADRYGDEDRQNKDGSFCDVVIDSALGPISARLELARAPLSASDFLRYLDQGLYAGGAFYRTVRPADDLKPVKIAVVQGGLTDESKYLPPIAHEPTNLTGLRHRNGTLSIARDSVGTGTAGAFFVCLGDQPELDFGGKRNPDGQGFAAFGRVTSGMKLLRKIGAMKTQGPPGSAGGELIATPVAILGARRV